MYAQALRLDPDFAPAHVGIGAALFELERQEEALESLMRAIALEMDPATAATAHYLAGRVLQALGRMAEAAVQFEHSIERDPNYAEALDHLARWRFAQQEHEVALDLYRAHAALEPDNATVHANIGVTLYFLNRHQDARASMERVLRLDPDHEMARNLIEELREAEPRPVR